MPTKLGPEIGGEFEKWLLYGPPGSSKTFTALTLPPPIYVVVFGAANELKTARSKQFLDKIGEPEIFFDVVEEPMGDQGRFVNAEAFDMACDKIDTAIEELDFKSLVLDSATGLGQVAMNKSIQVTSGMAKSKANTALHRLHAQNILIPGDQDWMGEMSLVSQIVDWCFRLPYHFALTAHEYLEFDMDRGTHQKIVTQRKPQFTGRNRDRMPAMFDNVWHMSMVGAGKAMQGQAKTTGDDITYAKTRMGGILPERVRDPNLSDIIEKFRSA